ncbi:glutaminase domain-containing protein [Ditylenchus destructor]|nr:glutaminase domain-containing protein [Ditylenchus destructor]
MKMMAPPRTHSSNTVNQYRAILNRKASICNILQQTADGLGSAFHRGGDKSPEDLIFELFKIPNKNEASIGKLLMVLKSYGLHKNDPRLQPMMEKIYEIERETEEMDKEAKDPKHWKLKLDDFRMCISQSLNLISRTLQNSLIVPSWSQFCDIIKEIYNVCTEMKDGKVATYIPQLARADPNLWGVSICTIDGQRISFGDTKLPFCFQSVSKAFNYAIAASDLGADILHNYVGQEPSGRLFNEICLDSKHRPHNPMVNSGAIIVTSLIQSAMNIADRFDYVLKRYKQIAGGLYVGFNNAVFLSERLTADRNCALAYYMKEYKCFPSETTSIIDALDFYFQLCSLEANCESAAVMAATLANGGVCPLTEERCIDSRPCRDVLSLMYSCGMYDYSGQFSFHVGLPAKSGVSGAMIVVVPNLMGICLWSPPLDDMGNTCKGVAFCKELIKRFNFHNYDSLAHTESNKFDPRKRFGEQERDQVVALLFSAKSGDLNTIRRIYMQDGDLEMCDYDKRTALHLAASEGHIETVKFLVNIAKVKVDPRDRWNRTPLDDAQTFGYSHIVVLLEKAMLLSDNNANDENNGDIRHFSLKVGGRLNNCVSVSSTEDEEDYTTLDKSSNEDSEDLAILPKPDVIFHVGDNIETT